MRLTASRQHLQTDEPRRRRTHRVEPLQEDVVPQQDVGLHQVLVVGVDAGADAAVCGATGQEVKPHLQSHGALALSDGLLPLRTHSSLWMLMTVPTRSLPFCLLSHRTSRALRAFVWKERGQKTLKPKYNNNHHKIIVIMIIKPQRQILPTAC